MRLVPSQSYGQPSSGATCVVYSDTALTEANREFGLLPDMRSWLDGDVILFSPRPVHLARETRSKSETVRTTQERLGYSPAHSLWTHAAVYIGNGEIVEANWSRDSRRNPVRRAEVSRYVPDAYVRRRTADELSGLQRAAIVLAALVRCGEDYAINAALEIYAKALAHKYFRPVPRFLRRRVASGLVCADIVSSSYDQAMRGPTFSAEDDAIIVPATLSATSILRDAEIEWCSLPRAASETAQA